MSARPENAIGAGAPACDEHAFYRDALEHLRRHDVPFLVGGAYALAHHGGVQRATKDFDIFVRPADCRRTLAVLAALGLRTEVTFTHWLAKAFGGEYFIDVIFGSGNGLCRVDDEWFAHAIDLELWGVPVQIVPAEEMIWSKASIMERDRFDGADIAHVLRAHGPELDWGRLLARFGGHWRVLLAHLVLFGFIYPSERERIPGAVLEELLERLRREGATPPADDRLCRGTLLSILQYRTDIEECGYRDARLPPEGTMSPEEVARWMAAFTVNGPL